MPPTPSKKHPYYSLLLRIAGGYNVVWGASVVLLPHLLFDWTGTPRPNLIWLWQCIGMIVGVYGIGYWIAAHDYVRHWPIVLVGLLGKIFGPIGFLFHLATGAIPFAWGWIILFNDVIWWVPFSAILYDAFFRQSHPLYASSNTEDICELSPPSMDIDSVHRATIASNGQSLWELSQHQKLLVVFLRHSGCTFCRELLAQIRDHRKELGEHLLMPLIVHMDTREGGQQLLDAFELGDVPHVSDPSCNLYRAYQLRRGTFWQLLGPSVWWRGFKAAILKRHGFGKIQGDGFQLGGFFLVYRGEIQASYPSRSAADLIPLEEILA